MQGYTMELDKRKKKETGIDKANISGLITQSLDNYLSVIQILKGIFSFYSINYCGLFQL